MRTKLAKRITKKALLLSLLEEYKGRLPLDVAAKRLYGRADELGRLKVIRAMNAYRQKDTRFLVIRVRDGNIQYLG